MPFIYMLCMSSVLPSMTHAPPVVGLYVLWVRMRAWRVAYSALQLEAHQLRNDKKLLSEVIRLQNTQKQQPGRTLRARDEDPIPPPSDDIIDPIVIRLRRNESQDSTA